MGSLVLPSRYDDVVLELTPTAHPFDGDYAILPTWQTTLTAKGCEVTGVYPEAEDEPMTLADFFDSLHADVRNGWEDERVWQSERGMLRLTVTHDGVNTVHVRVVMQGGGIEPRWDLTGDVFLDPGIFGPLASKARVFGDESLPKKAAAGPDG